MATSLCETKAINLKTRIYFEGKNGDVTDSEAIHIWWRSFSARSMHGTSETPHLQHARGGMVSDGWRVAEETTMGLAREVGLTGLARSSESE